VRCVIVDDVGVTFDSRDGVFAAESGVFARLAPLLDGARTVPEMLEALAATDSPMAVFGALDRLRAEGLIAEAPPSPSPDAPSPDAPSPAQAAFWEGRGLDPDAAAARLAATPVQVEAVSAAPGAARRLEDLLTSDGVRIDPGGALVLALIDDPLAPVAAAFNARARAEGTSWLPVRLEPDAVTLGPFLGPDAPSCWECLRRRAAAHDKLAASGAPETARPRVVQDGRGAPPSAESAALALAATEIGRWLAGDPDLDLDETLLRRDVLSGGRERHVLVPHPACPACAARRPAPPPRDPEGRVRLLSRPIAFDADGGRRIAPPERTAERLARHVSAVCGIVANLARVETPGAPPDLVHCHVAEHVFAPMNGSLARLREGREGRAAGKGRSDAQSRASALCEALERYSGVFAGHEPRRTARAVDLGDAAILPDDVLLFSQAQRTRAAAAGTAGQGAGAAWTPSAFDPEAEIEWSPAWSLTRERTVHVPAALAWYGYAAPRGIGFARADSNGAAAGNCLEEAILQGFLELVERDAVAIWWYNRLSRPQVDAAAFGDPYFDALARAWRDLGRETWLLDLTTDLGIPVIAAISRGTRPGPERLLFGFGAHFDVRLAASRAMTEVNQALAQLPQEVPPAGDGPFDWWPAATLAAHPWLGPDPRVAPRLAQDYPDRPSEDLRDDVLHCVSIAERHDLDMVVLDQTRADTGLCVARVFVPGLRHFWPRFAPGRLYDVPVRLGWRDRPTREEDLNPAHFFI
jgi:bacteriocin biosynthesis cyclodehydratase domain-containing protein